MIKSLSTAATGMQAQQTNIDVIANNLANASTTGFKRDFPFFQTFPTFDEINGTGPDVPEDQLNHSGGVSVAGVVTDHAGGPLEQTHGDYDLALAGDGFFRVLADGQPAMTRDGRFTLNEQGELVTVGHGWPVLSNTGQRFFFPPDTQKAEFSSDGTVWAVDNIGGRANLGELDLVRPESYPSLVKTGNNLFVGGGRPVPAGPELQVMQGYLEGSGTNSIQEMVHLIQASRDFETNLNMMRLQDDALGRLLQAVPLRA